MECEQRCAGGVKKKNESCRVTLRISTPLEIILLSIVITIKEVHFLSGGKASCELLTLCMLIPISHIM